MHKTCKKILLIISVVAVLAFIPVYSAGAAAPETEPDKPSGWAEAEVYAAIQEGLVPEELQGNYQKNITRSHYVLLALKAFNLSGKTAETKEERPFMDTSNNVYEAEIIRAFNAGIVKGDGKGNFFPENFITREEIASLVVNLLKQVSPDKDFTVKGKFEYADGSEISGWAKEYIDVCFENQILTGVGGNRIAPKGNASVEQSIALIYRLSQKEGLLNKHAYGKLKLDSTFNEKDEPDAATVNRFVSIYGEELFNVFRELSENPDISVTDIRGDSITLFLNDENTICMDTVHNEKRLLGMMHDINDELSVSVYKQLMNTFDNPEQGMLLFDEYIEGMKSNEVINIKEDIGEDGDFLIESQQEDSKIIYIIRFVQK